MALIYIVEDDENIREIETIALKNSNYMVCAFEKATTFYKKLEDIMPDLVLLDVMLPDESGYDIVRKLRKNPATKKLPVIMVTANRPQKFGYDQSLHGIKICRNKQARTAISTRYDHFRYASIIPGTVPASQGKKKNGGRDHCPGRSWVSSLP